MSGGHEKFCPSGHSCHPCFLGTSTFPQRKTWKIYVHVGRYPKGQMSLYKKAARLQVPSHSVAQAVSEELSDGTDRVLTIPYPLPFSSKPEIQHKARPKRVLYAGRMHPEKGVLELVRAWNCLAEPMRKEWHLRLVGPWREEEGGGGEDFKKSKIGRK